MRARPCALSACEGPVDDDRLEEFGTGVITSITVLSKGTGYYGGLASPIKLAFDPANDGMCNDFSIVPLLESSELVMTSTEPGMAAPLVGFHLQLGLEMIRHGPLCVRTCVCMCVSASPSSSGSMPKRAL